MEENQLPTCKTCAFFDRLEDTRQGECRANPPRGEDYVDAWPTVSETSWCGAHPERRALVQAMVNFNTQLHLQAIVNRSRGMLG